MEVDASSVGAVEESEEKLSEFISVMEKEESVESGESGESESEDEDLGAAFDPSSPDNPNLQINQQRARLLKKNQKKAAKDARRQMRD
jgi:hypothetical protein